MIGFDRRNARGLTATFELRIRVRRGREGLPFTVRIDDGRLRLRPGSPPRAEATATLHARDVLRLGIGRASWPQLLASGRLELAGDPFLALRVPGLFKLPTK
jgi:SCP-2 sterol transfer family